MDNRISGAVTRARGAAERIAGDSLGDLGLQVRGRADELRGRAVESYGWAVNQAERLAADLPVELRDVADRGVDFARRKPLVTAGIVAGVVAVLLGALAGERRYRR